MARKRTPRSQSQHDRRKRQRYGPMVVLDEIPRSVSEQCRLREARGLWRHFDARGHWSRCRSSWIEQNLLLLARLGWRRSLACGQRRKL